MPAALLVLVTAIYAGVAVDFACTGKWPLAIMYAGYAFANIGPILLVTR